MKTRRGQSIFEYVALVGTAILLVTIIMLLLRGNIFGPQQKEITNQSQQFYNLTQCLKPGYFNCTYCPDDKCPSGVQCNSDGSCSGTVSPSPSSSPSPTPSPSASPSPTPTSSPTPSPSPSCSVSLNPTSVIGAGSSAVTVSHSDFDSVPQSITVDCGQSQISAFCNAQVCTGTCEYSNPDSTAIAYTVTASISSVQCTPSNFVLESSSACVWNKLPTPKPTTIPCPTGVPQDGSGGVCKACSGDGCIPIQCSGQCMACPLPTTIPANTNVCYLSCRGPV